MSSLFVTNNYDATTVCVSTLQHTKKLQPERAHSGNWEGELTKWLGCVCEKIHPPPVEVFWLQCDGPCGSWYNVSPNCIGINASEAERLLLWRCPQCQQRYLRVPTATQRFLELPDHLIYKILQYSAPGPEIIYAIHSLSLVCSMTNHAIRGKQWNGVWEILASEQCALSNYRPRKRPRRRLSHALQPLSAMSHTPKDHIQDYFMALCQRTEDAHMALGAILDSNQTPLSVERLRRILDQGILINRRSQCGMTFLHECCTADYVDARVVHRCVQDLLTRYQADPSILATGESDGNRPAIFLAISRLMPSVAEALIQAGANLNVKVKGTFRLVSNPEKTFRGAFTPLDFARRLKEEEDGLEAEKTAKPLSQYWRKRLRDCIATLSTTRKG